MGRFGSLVSAVLALLLIIMLAGLTGCSGSSPVKSANYPVPASVSITPSPDLSLELGTNQAFSVTVQNSANALITEPVTYVSSNPAVVTVAANGLACAGSWDSLASPQVCTPGGTGVAEVTAVALGVSSSPTTVYVHQHVDKVVISTVSTIPPAPNTPCLSVGQTIEYQARAFSRGADITSTVGIFTWRAATLGVANVSTAATGLQQGQVQVTAKVPGVTPLFASIGNANSIPVNFTTCAVQSITLAVTGATASSTTITPTVIDSLGTVIGTTSSSLPLTWSSSESASVSTSSSGVASAASSGGRADDHRVLHAAQLQYRVSSGQAHLSRECGPGYRQQDGHNAESDGNGLSDQHRLRNPGPLREHYRSVDRADKYLRHLRVLAVDSSIIGGLAAAGFTLSMAITGLVLADDVLQLLLHSEEFLRFSCSTMRTSDSVHFDTTWTSLRER